MTATKKTRRQVSTRAKAGKGGRKFWPIHRVLVPIDFSPLSLEAIEFALPLLRLSGAELHLAHVVPPGYPISSLSDLPMVDPEIEIHRRICQHLIDAAKSYPVELSPKNVHALMGRPFEEICRLAGNIAIDLIVTSTRGNTGLKHLFLGSTAERIVRYSPCPVAVVRRPDRTPDESKSTHRSFGFEKILVPIDFSPCSLEGLEYAKTLAVHFGSKLMLLHSVYLEYAAPSDQYPLYDFPMLMPQVQKAARAQMQDFVHKTDWKGVEVEQSLQIGHAGQQICARAEEFGADLIVTSTHGTTGLKHLLIGSTAEYVVRHAPCPVLVAPNHKRPH